MRRLLTVLSAALLLSACADTDTSPPQSETAASSNTVATSATIQSSPAPTSTTQPKSDSLEPPESEQASEDTYMCFECYEICVGDEVYNRIYGKSYVENDDIALEDLRYLRMSYYDFSHTPRVGEMIVNAKIADDVMSIFRELFENGYELETMRLVEDFWQGDGASTDLASMAANNCSCFCYREVTYGGKLSYHALGLAIDINPRSNPYVWYENGQMLVLPENAYEFADRTADDPHFIRSGDFCCKLFERYGFEWGGDWETPIDYQHFEVHR